MRSLYIANKPKQTAKAPYRGFCFGGNDLKLGFVGQGHCMLSKLSGTPIKELLKKFLKNPQNFQKGLFINIFFESS